MVYHHIPLPTIVGSALCMRIIHGLDADLVSQLAGFPLNVCAWLSLPILPLRDIWIVCDFFVIYNKAEPITPVCADVCLSLECVSRSVVHSSTEGLQGWNHFHNNAEIHLPSSLCLHLHPWWKAMTGHPMVEFSVNQNRYKMMLVIFDSSPPGGGWVSLK